MINKLLFIFFISSYTFDNSFTCKHLFHKEYLLFFAYSDFEDVKQEVTMFDESDDIKGILLTNPCKDVTVPEECNSEQKEAKLVFIKDTVKDDEQKCLLFDHISQWNWRVGVTELKNKMISVTDQVQTEEQDLNNKDEVKELQYHFEYQFVCDALAIKPKYNARYIGSKKLFEISIQSRDGCGIELSFLKLLEEYDLITGIIFCAIGVIMCFAGYKLYKDMLVIFTVLIATVLGFYLYMSYVEKSTAHNGKIWLILFVLVVVMGVFTLLVFFSNLVYFLLAMMISYKIGLLIHTYLEQKLDFFQKDYTEYLVMAVIFLVFALIYVQIHEYFIVLCTAPLGASFIILSFHYFRLTEFDFLFELEFNSPYVNFLVIFFLMTVVGIFCQVQFFLKKEEKKDKMNIELDFKP